LRERTLFLWGFCVFFYFCREVPSSPPSALFSAGTQPFLRRVLSNGALDVFPPGFFFQVCQLSSSFFCNGPGGLFPFVHPRVFGPPPPLLHGFCLSCSPPPTANRLAFNRKTHFFFPGQFLVLLLPPCALTRLCFFCVKQRFVPSLSVVFFFVGVRRLMISPPLPAREPPPPPAFPSLFFYFGTWT